MLSNKNGKQRKSMRFATIKKTVAFDEQENVRLDTDYIEELYSERFPVIKENEAWLNQNLPEKFSHMDISFAEMRTQYLIELLEKELSLEEAKDAEKQFNHCLAIIEAFNFLYKEIYPTNTSGKASRKSEPKTTK